MSNPDIPVSIANLGDRIRSHTQTLVIADSNGKQLAEAGFTRGTVLALPNLAKSCDIIQSLETRIKHIPNIVLAVGINNCKDLDPSQSITALKGLVEWGRETGHRVCFSNVPDCTRFAEIERQGIHRINKFAREIFGLEFIDAVDPARVEINPHDITGVHYNRDTAVRYWLLHSYCSAFKCLVNTDHIPRHHIASDFIINLSSHTLSDAEVSLLNKGLSFIPTVKCFPLSLMESCIYRNLRNIKLRDYFFDKDSEDNTEYDPNAFHNKFINRSTWIPALNKLSSSCRYALQHLQDYIQKYIYSDIWQPNQPARLRTFSNNSDNLSPEERSAMRSLKSNSNILIKPADKGGAVVLLDVESYRAEGLRQLHNTDYYRPISESSSRNTVSRINAILMRMKNRGFISYKQYSYLAADFPEDPRCFYSYLKFTRIIPNGRLLPCQTQSLTAVRRHITSVNYLIIISSLFRYRIQRI